MLENRHKHFSYCSCFSKLGQICNYEYLRKVLVYQYFIILQKNIGKDENIYLQYLLLIWFLSFTFIRYLNDYKDLSELQNFAVLNGSALAWSHRARSKVSRRLDEQRKIL